MAGFYVDERALDRFAASLDALGRAVLTAQDYGTDHIDVGVWDAGMVLAGAAPTVDRVRASIAAVLATLGGIASGSAARVRDAAAASRAADGGGGPARATGSGVRPAGHGEGLQ